MVSCEEGNWSSVKWSRHKGALQGERGLGMNLNIPYSVSTDVYGLELASCSLAVERLSMLSMIKMGTVHFISALERRRDELAVLEETGGECKRGNGLTANTLALWDPKLWKREAIMRIKVSVGQTLWHLMFGVFTVFLVGTLNLHFPNSFLDPVGYKILASSQKKTNQIPPTP